MLAVSREQRIFHVDVMWTSTKGKGVSLVWTGRGQKPDLLVNIINVLSTIKRSLATELNTVLPKILRLCNSNTSL